MVVSFIEVPAGNLMPTDRKDTPNSPPTSLPGALGDSRSVQPTSIAAQLWVRPKSRSNPTKYCSRLVCYNRQRLYVGGSRLFGPRHVGVRREAKLRIVEKGKKRSYGTISRP